jgi:hypothetical protein
MATNISRRWKIPKPLLLLSYDEKYGIVESRKAQ